MRRSAPWSGTGIHKGWELFGIRRGYAGRISGHLQPMGARDVSNILQQGKTVLGSARCSYFETEEGRKRALEVLHQHGYV